MQALQRLSNTQKFCKPLVKLSHFKIGHNGIIFIPWKSAKTTTQGWIFFFSTELTSCCSAVSLISGIFYILPTCFPKFSPEPRPATPVMFFAALAWGSAIFLRDTRLSALAFCDFALLRVQNENKAPSVRERSLETHLQDILQVSSTRGLPA